MDISWERIRRDVSEDKHILDVGHWHDQSA